MPQACVTLQKSFRDTFVPSIIHSALQRTVFVWKPCQIFYFTSGQTPVASFQMLNKLQMTFYILWSQEDSILIMFLTWSFIFSHVLCPNHTDLMTQARTFELTSIYLFAVETDLELRYISEGDKMNPRFAIEFFILHNIYNREIK